MISRRPILSLANVNGVERELTGGYHIKISRLRVKEFYTSTKTVKECMWER